MTDPTGLSGDFYHDDAVTIWHANALELPLPDASVDLVVTSPPYFGLRSYQDDGRHYAGQIGDEATPAEFVDALIAATREMVRVLKPSGSIWVNLGDKYVADNRGSSADYKRGDAKYAPRGPAGFPTGGMRQKSLMGIPWRYALRCIDDLRLILRAEVIWAKPNGLPESVTDRVRRSHEHWFHMTREPRYYSAVDEVREGYAPGTAERYAKGYNRTDYQTGQVRKGIGVDYSGTFDTNALGKLPGSVWTIPTQPLTVPPELGVNHFAAFPMEWPRRIITGWSPREVCSACREGRRPVAYTPSAAGHVRASLRVRDGNAGLPSTGSTSSLRLSGGPMQRFRAANPTTITGYACACPDTSAPATPGVVLDPFAGTGTVGVVARALGRHAHLVDLSADYCRLAQWRVTDPGERARAMQVEKPPKPMDGQLDIFEVSA